MKGNLNDSNPLNLLCEVAVVLKDWEEDVAMRNWRNPVLRLGFGLQFHGYLGSEEEVATKKRKMDILSEIWIPRNKRTTPRHESFSIPIHQIPRKKRSKSRRIKRGFLDTTDLQIIQIQSIGSGSLCMNMRRNRHSAYPNQGFHF